MKQQFISILLLFKLGITIGKPSLPTLFMTGPDELKETIDTGEIENSEEMQENLKPYFKQFHITSNIQFRYAHTVVEAYLLNPTNSSKEVTFTVILPEKAFVSNFSMTLNKKEYLAKVEEKIKATKSYNEAKNQNQFAGIASSNARDVNQIEVSVNVGARGKARFCLTYEELLQRHLSRYQQDIHLNLDQVVEDFKVQVNINESLPVIQTRVPEFITDPNSINTKYIQNKLAQVETNFDGDRTKTRIIFEPDVQAQKEMLKEKNGKNVIQCQFIVQYDVDRKSEDNHIQIIDGYFVHFFAPQHQEPLPKYIVFVLDVSGSMSDEKLMQTKDAMVTILDNLTDDDYFSILTFSDTNKLWVPEAKLRRDSLQAYRGTKELRAEAIKYITELEANGGTNIHNALKQSLAMVAKLKASQTSEYSKLKPLVLFMTDGEPTTGITISSEIEKRIGAANDKLEVPIFGLAFGHDADFNLVKSISVNSGAFARKIYEGLDAALQLEDFYMELSSPLLDKVKFDYVGEAFENKSITNKDLQTYYEGTEHIIAGRIDSTNNNENIQIVITGEGKQGSYNKKLTICKPVSRAFVDALEGQSREYQANYDGLQLPENCFAPPERNPKETSTLPNFIERLWAFLTIKDLLDDKMAAKDKRIEKLKPKNYEARLEDVRAKKVKALPATIGSSRVVTKEKTREKRALEMALKYNFVTKLTSLVVTKPSVVDNIPKASAVRSEEKMRFDLTPVSCLESYRKPQNANFWGPLHLSMPIQTGWLLPLDLPTSSNAMSIKPEISTGQSLSGVQFPGPTKHSSVPYSISQNLLSGPGTSKPHSSSSNIPKQNSPSGFSGNSCSGNLTLYNKTYLRGASIVFDTSVKNMQNHSFNDQVTSMEIEGTCCWMLYNDPLYQGYKLKFRPGQFKSSTDLGRMFRNIGSAQKVKCNFS